jgi:hypothetical protein
MTTMPKSKSKKTAKSGRVDLTQQMLKGLPPGFASKPIVPTRSKKQIPGDDESGLTRNPDVPGDPVIDFPEYREKVPTVSKVEHSIEANGFERNLLRIADAARKVGGYISPRMKAVMDSVSTLEARKKKTKETPANPNPKKNKKEVTADES